MFSILVKFNILTTKDFILKYPYYKLNESIVWVWGYRGRDRMVVGWQLDLQLHMQSVPIITDVVRSNLDQGEVYTIM